MTVKLTTTTIARLFATRSKAIAQITKSSYCGDYDSPPKYFKQAWAIYLLSDPDRFYHETDFDSAILTLAENFDEFELAVANNVVSFANTISLGLEFGRVISDHELWNGVVGVEEAHRHVRFHAGIILFHTFESQATLLNSAFEIVKHEYNVREMNIQSRTVFASRKFR